MATKALRKTAEAALRVKFPWLNAKIPSFFFNLLMNFFEHVVYEALSSQATMIVINFQTTKERDAYLKSLEELINSSKEGEPSALEKVRRTLEDLIRFNGVVSK